MADSRALKTMELSPKDEGEGVVEERIIFEVEDVQ